MSSTKRVTEWGLLVKPEASYGAGGTPSASTDGVLVLERPSVEIDWAADGKRRGEGGPMSHGIKRVPKSGAFAQLAAICEAHGYGAAYSATNVPNIHDLAIAAGLAAEVDTTEDSETVTYTPGTAVSAVVEAYERAQKFILKGVYADLNISADAGAVPVWEFPLVGIPTLPTDLAVPTITYPTVQPPIAEGLTLSIGDFASAVVRSFEFALNRENTPRLDANAAAGHGGYSIGGINPTLEVLCEATALQTTPFHGAAGLDPYQLAEAATAIAVSLTVGATQYNKWTLSGTAAQLVDVADDEDGASAIWTLVFELNPTTSGGKDNLSILFD